MFWILLTTSLMGSSCEHQYKEHLHSDMSLSYEQFDQTMGQGFRALVGSCKAEAINLLKNYIVLNNAEQDSLRWHIAQLSGELGRIDEAIMYANSTLRSDEKGGFKWNDYVAGYIAYWQNDPVLLKEKINTLEAGDGHQGNLINAKLLNTFLKQLEKD